ncbi:TetR/AcrR family transcriptional regulator [Rhizobium alvei]|uniref:TetR/AcrR family transcriptional regulator n=1 Tax=Rhizobium alvei TaxID=1132659 RepID=A0ABT8YR51_9HYPH|nr:TetR/AcrR family transcriptional regulator [Rhizobium alvei]MDO6965635.1 TetR/AcrR family transcriptional regulator [Rhizobium alvei]
MSETPSPRYLPHDDRKRAIAAAARSLIIEKGFEGLRTREIAERVGINIATLHYHVPSKEALIALVAQSMRDEFVAQHLQRDRKGLTARQKLEIEITEFRETRDNNPELLKVMEEMTRRAKYDDNVAHEIIPLRIRWFEGFVSILDEGRNDGSFRPDLDPVAGAYLVIGALIATASMQIGSDDPLDRVSVELLRALGANPSGT